MGPLAVGGVSEPSLGRKLAAWWILVGALILVAFWSASLPEEDRNQADAVYTYEFGLGGLMLYGILLGVVLAIAVGLNYRDTFALRRPTSWSTAAGLTLATLVALFVVAALLELVFHTGEEQGLDPAGWQPDRAGAFALSFVAIALFGPIVEELTYRGLGFFLLSQFGTWAAVIVTGLAFSLSHGIIVGIPVFFVIGAGLAYMRVRTQSILPAIVVHMLFNGLQLVASVSG